MASVTRSSHRAEDPPPTGDSMRPQAAILDQAVAEGGGTGGAQGRTKRKLQEYAHGHNEPSKRTRVATQGRSVAQDRADAPPAGAGQTSATNLTKHQAKVANGIRHELDRLATEGSVDREGKRKLRSQESTRFKSELAQYFPDYDEVIGNDEKQEYLFNIDTPILVSDSANESDDRHRGPDLGTVVSVRSYGDALYTEVSNAQRIDLSSLGLQQFKNIASEDPLHDSVYEKIHRRAERLERNIRNTEKGRAQHDRDRIVQLKESLEGQDWLKVMGVSGVTEARKKTFEPARRYFISGCQAIIDKFTNWKNEEKRRKAEKNKADAEAEEEGEEEEESEEASDEEDDSSHATSEASSPAKQLREEAMARSRLTAKIAKRPRPRPLVRPDPPIGPPPPPKEFKSFFEKQHERDSAVNRTRRGRKVLAWGLPIPEFSDADFELPAHFLDEDKMRARARKKRADKRRSKG
ncbi:something about silencing, SAS, complex subunit 4-domain-containing protein [Emericellopsis atlantica]|uniref:Something about silencing, SAS, complex subunit 4-domain-containing protein n=1 Tax=Emericellopsis atlantica TaxID=2614577 RepID=A0A9P7ZUX0_9HYPO|nr:something about silencing, SAS, complex subunit 4-domain-containing protein [Emericellopsis atlantica]KAG9258261.1 something about silencing, SAS, complex subunit 4-domain-containing protein [Emericellopsis atlantica]